VDTRLESFALQHYEESIKPTKDSNLFGALSKAYNEHRTLVFTPDWLWYSAALLFSGYVNAHPDDLRHLFVAHEGKKQLTIEDANGADWSYFFDQIIKLIKKNVISANMHGTTIVDVLQNDFSTTTPMFTCLSTALVMDTLKSYFEYGRMMTLCGLPAVEFEGKIEDYQKIATKLDQLISDYVMHDDFKKKLERFRMVVLKFIDTMNGQVDLFFWQSFMDILEQHGGSGQHKEYVSGWVLYLFGEDGPFVETQNLKTVALNVPIKLADKDNNLESDCHLMGGFFGYHEDQETGSITPSISMGLFVDTLSTKPLTAETRAKLESGKE